MSEILFQYYQVNPTTWMYLSSLLSIALFFKFNRVWSVRNLDLVGLVLLAPGLLAVVYGSEQGGPAVLQAGYIWLFSISAVFLVRMLADSLMVRRPLLEPNLSTGGLVFLGISLLVFLLANVIVSSPQQADLAAAAATSNRPQAREEGALEDPLERLGPGYPLLFMLPRISAQRIFSPDADGTGTVEADDRATLVNETTARVMAILAQLAIVGGMVVTGWRHFGNVRLGIAAAVLYLLLPYTALMTGRVDHALPGALVIWAIAAYRRPLAAGFLIGMAMGTIYYPVFLLPLWCSFYWERGIRRFATGVAAALVCLVLALLVVRGPDSVAFAAQVRQMFGWIFPNEVTLEGFWALPAHDAVFRLPVLAAFVAMMATLAIWPSPKNLGTLMSCTAAVLIGAQFWKAHNGGLFMAWFLPVLLLVVFRPNLENRVALLMLEPEWFPPRGRKAA